MGTQTLSRFPKMRVPKHHLDLVMKTMGTPMIWTPAVITQDSNSGIGDTANHYGYPQVFQDSY